ncbi:uncharacterized protein LOC124681517 [Lolium rigidum]|uniref:uncharacterized protein LOC124681517 n=1 Tax=Lolium rigidum TaxID=89674 RepID=UPI001F5D0BE5|nr:uncharacterized protein LOC124681517 [Lolium rigidum]
MMSALRRICCTGGRFFVGGSKLRSDGRGSTLLVRRHSTGSPVINYMEEANKWAKSSGGKKVVTSLFLTFGATIFVDWYVSSVKSHAKKYVDEMVTQQDESTKAFQMEFEKELQQLERKLDSFLDDKKMMLIMNDKQLSVAKRADLAYNSKFQHWEEELTPPLKKTSFAVVGGSQDVDLLPITCSVCGHAVPLLEPARPIEEFEAPGTKALVIEEPGATSTH